MGQDLAVVKELVYFRTRQGFPLELRTEIRPILKTPFERPVLKKAKCIVSG